MARCANSNLALGLGMHGGETRARSPLPPVNSEIPKSIDGGGTRMSAGAAARRRTCGEDGLWLCSARSGSLLLASRSRRGEGRELRLTRTHRPHRRRLSGGEETTQLLYLAAGRKGVADASALDTPDACWHRLGEGPRQIPAWCDGVLSLVASRCRRSLRLLLDASARHRPDLARRRRSLTQLPARRRSVTRAGHE